MLNRFALQRAWSYIFDLFGCSTNLGLMVAQSSEIVFGFRRALFYKIMHLDSVLLLIGMALCPCVVHAGDQNILSGITLTISCTSKSDATNTNTNNNSNTSTQTHHKIHNNQAPVQSAAQAVIPNTSSVLHYKSHIFKRFADKKVMLGALCIAYVSIVATLYGMEHVCQRYCPWAHWKDEFTLGKLRRIPEKELADELFDTVNTQYASTDNDEDFLKPLVSFMNAIDREIAWHQKFLSLHRWLDYCFIFPKQQEAQKAIAHQYERLTYIRKVLVTWLTSYTNDEIRHGSNQKAAH